MTTPQAVDTYDAILPAGGRISGKFAQEAGTEVKALIRFEGQTVLRRTVEALRATGRVCRIVVIGGEEARSEARACGVDGDVAEGVTGPENILRGLEWLFEQPHGPTPHVLNVTTDLPFLTSEAVCAYLNRCPSEADVAVPLVTQRAFDARFPGTNSTYTPLREGTFTPGCVLRLEVGTLRRCRPHLEPLFAARKSPLQMARLIGSGIAWRYLTRRLSVGDLVARAEAVLGCKGAPVYDAPPELAYDIDLLTDYRYAQRLAKDEG